MNNRGFTLVELLIVVGVISILAMITTVMYGTWRTRTAETEVKSDLIQASGAMENYKNFNTGYPATIPNTFSASQNVTITVQNVTSSSYCLKATEIKVPSVVYFISSTNAQPHTGAC